VAIVEEELNREDAKSAKRENQERDLAYDLVGKRR